MYINIRKLTKRRSKIEKLFAGKIFANDNREKKYTRAEEN
jgi:hypothetical protein